VTGGGEAPKYRPVTLWFLAVVAAVVGLVLLGDWLKRKFG